jgi:3-oxoadipate enol-lactonase
VKVVLLHAFPLDERMWQPQREALAEHEVVTPNLYGLGGSSLNAWAQRLLGDVEGDLALVGASMGGYAALAMARQAPERVRGLLLADSRPDADSSERRAGRADTIRLIEEEGAAGLWENQRSKLFAEEAAESAVGLAREMTLARSEDELVRAIAAIRDRQDNSGLLTSLEVPIVFGQGAGDLFFPIDEARSFAERPAQGRLVVFERSRHLPSLEQPEDFNRMLLEFLEEADEVDT